MDHRVAAGALFLVCAGCFEEPPSGSGGGPSSGVGTSSGTSSGTGGGSSGPEGSSGAADASSSSSSSSTSSGTNGCSGTAMVMPETVEPDILLLLDTGIIFDGSLSKQSAVLLLEPGTQVAVFAPDGAALEFPLAFDCVDGCGSCGGSQVRRVFFPYTGSPFAAVADVLGAGGLDCVFRSPLSPSSSGPAKHLWFLTTEPEQALPEGLESAVAGAGFRLHVACPDCAVQLPDSAAALQSVVDATRGTVADSTAGMQVVAQLGLMIAPRHSCRWEASSLPGGVEIETDPPFGDGDTFTFSSTMGPAGCEPSDPEAGYFVDGPHLQLCPFACAVAQEWPVMATTITELEVCE